MRPNVNEFKDFYALLIQSAPSRYIPWLFVLEPQNKDPLSSRPWTAEKSRLSYDEAVRFMAYGYNIGISARDGDPLTLIDIDNVGAIPNSEIKPTLSVITRSRVGNHNYYFSSDPKCNTNIPTDHGEIRSSNQYLVCPGSYVKTNIANVPFGQEELCGYYTLDNKVPPVTITYNDFPKVFRDHAERIAQIPPRPRQEPSGLKSKSKLFDLTIDDIVRYPKNKARFASVFHGSDSGSNTAVSNGLLHCFRHLVSHNALQALSVMAGLYTCQDAGVSHRNGGSGESMLDLSDGETIYKLWDYARRNGYVPKNDPPPSGAVRYFAVEAGICNVSELEDEWRLPIDIYRECIHLLSINV